VFSYNINGEDTFLVEFQRRNGDVIAFSRCYSKVLTILGTAIVWKPAHPDYCLPFRSDTADLQEQCDLGLDLQDECISNFCNVIIDVSTPHEMKKQIAELLAYGSKSSATAVGSHPQIVKTLKFLLTSQNQDLARCGAACYNELVCDTDSELFRRDHAEKLLPEIRALLMPNCNFTSDTLQLNVARACCTIAEFGGGQSIQDRNIVTPMQQLLKDTPSETTRIWAKSCLNYCASASD
jgi:hypothetical protein